MEDGRFSLVLGKYCSCLDHRGIDFHNEWNFGIGMGQGRSGAEGVILNQEGNGYHNGNTSRRINHRLLLNSTHCWAGGLTGKDDGG